jgi:hypothetical protein
MNNHQKSYEIGKGTNNTEKTKDSNRKKDLERRMKKAFNMLLSLEHGWCDNEENKPFNPEFLESIKETMKAIDSLVASENGAAVVISPLGTNDIDAHWNNDFLQLLLNMEMRSNGTVAASIFARFKETGYELCWAKELDGAPDAVERWLKAVKDDRVARES